MSASAIKGSSGSPQNDTSSMSEEKALQGSVDHVQAVVCASEFANLPPTSPKRVQGSPLESSNSPSKVQGVVQTIFNPGSPWEAFRRHFAGLANPYAIKYIRTRLAEFCAQNLDPTQEPELCRDPKLPSETKRLFKSVVNQLSTMAKEQTPALMIKAIEATKGRIQEELDKKPVDVIGWEELDSLFRFPEFLALPDQDYRKIMQCIEQEDIPALREFMGELDERKVIDLKKLKKDCKHRLRHDFDTLIGQIIRKKPQKREGIVTYVDQSEKFFKDKTLSFREPTGESYNGTIAKFVGSPDSLKFTLHDQSIVTISLPSFALCHETKHVTRKLWTHLVNGSFDLDSDFVVEHSCETDILNGILPGRYRLVDAKKVNGWAFPGFGTTSEYFECTLEDVATNKKKYTLQGECASTGSRMQVYIIEQRKTFHLTVAHFEASHIGIKTKQQIYSGISAANADDLVLIRDNRSESHIRMLRLAEIQQQLDALRRDLLDEKNRDLLHLLLDDFVKKNLTFVESSFSLLGKYPDLAHHIQQVSQKYFDDLKIEKKVWSILQDLVLEANYVIHVIKKGNIDYARAIQLLEEAKQHAEKIQDKEGIFVMGNTGSGKSTAIGFLLGAKFKEVPNHVGEKVWNIKKDTDRKESGKTGSEEYPKVGQSIGMSETIYAQGFPIKEPEEDLENVVFVDCPGFQDTRGIQNEICSAYSIDLAVKKAKSLRSLVVVIPASAFTADRGNPVIDLIHSVRERFPDTFKPTDSTSTPRVYVLVTKVNQFKGQGELLKKIKDGTRFDELIKELQGQIEELTKKGAEPQGFEIQTLQRRLNVWKALKRMLEDQKGPNLPTHRKERFSSIDLNKFLRNDLLAAYSARQLVPKANYNTALSGAFLQREFSKIIQNSAHTWRVLILGHYLSVIPKEIAETEAGITLSRTLVQEGEAEKKRKEEEAASLKKQIQSDLDYLQRLLANQNKTGKEEEDLRKTLLSNAKTQTKQQIEKDERSLEQCARNLSKKNDEINKAKSEINLIEEQKKTIAANIDKKTKQIEDLKMGEKPEELNYTHFVADQRYHFGAWISEESVQEAFVRVAPAKTDLNPNIGFIQMAKNYEGITTHVVPIEKGFRLVPSNADLRRDFFFSSEQVGGFRVKVEGKRYEFLGCHSLADGKKIGYKFKLTWIPGEELPWIKITHVIPNHEYNAGQINNLETEIEIHRRDLISIDLKLEGTQTIRGVKAHRSALEKEIGDLNEQQRGLKIRIKENENNLVIEEISESIKQYEKSVATKNKLLANAQDTATIEEKIRKNNLEITAKQEILRSLKTKLRDVAIIISTQWKSAIMISELVGLVTNDPSAEPAAKETCLDFIKIFNENRETLLAKIKKEHGF